MTMGIEQFRHITEQGALENRRVRLEGNEGQEELRAPNNLWGRFVDWIKGIGHKGVVTEKRATNNDVRQALYDALVKSEGSDFAELVIKTVTGKDGETFTTKGTNLQASRVKEILDTSDKLRVQYRRQNGTELGKYVRDNLGSVVNALSLSPRCRRDLCWNWVTRSPAFREYRVRRRGQLADRWMFWQASANRQPFAC
jgi:hypothetical protein